MWQDLCIYGRGNWSASAGKLKLTNREIQSAESSTCAHDSWKDSRWGPWKPANPVSTTEYYKLGTDEHGKYAIIETERIKNGEDYMKYQFDPS